jgi:hypothetical protein
MKADHFKINQKSFLNEGDLHVQDPLLLQVMK